MTTLRYFKLEEFNCKHTGRNGMRREFLLKLDELRHRVGLPMVVTSGYRDPSHPVEAKKDRPGYHSRGIAADIKATDSEFRFKLLKHALEMGFTGIGIDKGFIHLDIRDTTPVVWVYGD